MRKDKLKPRSNVLYTLLANRYFGGLKRWYMLRYYKGCLRETLIRTIKGEQGLELARRFFNYKIYQLSKPK